MADRSPAATLLTHNSCRTDVLGHLPAVLEVANSLELVAGGGRGAENLSGDERVRVLRLLLLNDLDGANLHVLLRDDLRPTVITQPLITS